MRQEVNLFPQDHCRWQVARRRLLQWGAVWIAAFFLVSIIYWIRCNGQESSHAQLMALESEYAPIKKLQTEVATTRALIEDLQKRESLALELADEQPLLALVGILSRAARDCDGEVCIQHLSLVRKVATNKAENGSEPPASHKLLILKGLGVNNLAVARFAASLRESRVFKAVELESTGAPIRGEDTSRSYQLECTF